MDYTVHTIFGRIHVRLTSYYAAGKRGGELVEGLKRETPDEEDVELDIIEQIILAHACSGVDVESSAYAAGIDTVMEYIANNT